ncbi:hypothetical protein JYK00_03970 [Thermosipho ferrireducens]|uniref:Uncharacterized protein n=1 Tax=Thermosipho ferrireducens TaxID=2571116 RepID=A0ABX7S9V4_9BACT|nr:hypothetical protein [Thermosipho ferrireducens]QTA38675.1 hypothetical protein JYK00_03970 [Thermosipho ferrireducens]
MKYLIFLYILIFTFSFGTNIYFNTYNHTVFFNGKIYSFQGNAQPYRGKIVRYYKGINIPNVNLPGNLLVLKDGQTIGTNGTIKIPSDLFETLKDWFLTNKINDVIIDNYPVEIYSNKIYVKNFMSKEKLYEYLELFLKEFELPDLEIYYGKYDITPEKPSVKISTFIFPDAGFYAVSGMDKGQLTIKTYINGNISDHMGILPSGTYTILAVAMDQLGLEASSTTTLFIPASTITFVEKTVEIGNNTKFGTINFIGKKNFYEISTINSTITTITSTDTTPPSLKIVTKRITDNYYYIKVITSDKTSFNTIALLNSIKIESGIRKLSTGLNVLIVYSEDSFGNFSFAKKEIRALKNLKSAFKFFGEKRWINIGGFLFKTPYIKSWVKPEVKRWITDEHKKIIRISP